LPNLNQVQAHLPDHLCAKPLLRGLCASSPRRAALVPRGAQLRRRRQPNAVGAYYGYTDYGYTYGGHTYYGFSTLRRLTLGEADATCRTPELPAASLTF